MSNPLDNESRKLIVGGSPASSTIPIEPFPRFPNEIKTNNPLIQRAWNQVENEIDRWRKNLFTSMQASQQESPDADIKLLNDQVAALQASLKSIGGQNTGSISTLQQNVTNILTQFGNFLKLSGGTMIGSLILDHDPVLALEAATKRYVQSVVVGINQYVHVQLTPTTPWYMNHGRDVVPGGVRLFKEVTMQEIQLVDKYDITPGTTLALFGYNESGIGVLTFS